MSNIKIKLISLIIILSTLTPLSAQIVTDGTLGSKVSLNATDMLIPETLGQQMGSNLFHSFEKFNIHQGQSATFTGSNHIKNIISRITGGQLSTIDGLLKSNIPDADLYLINPSGFIFDQHTQLDIQGTFHAHATEYISFEDESIFSTTSAEISTLTMASPNAYGLLDPPLQPAEIAIHTDIKNSTFYAPAGRISVNKADDLTIQDSILFAFNGEIDIQTTGRLDLSLTTLQLLPDIDGDGEVDIGNIDVKSGFLHIQAHDFIASKALLLADNYNFSQSFGIDIQIDNEFTLQDGASIVSRNFNAEGQGGNIDISADKLTITGFNPETIDFKNPIPSLSTVTSNTIEGIGGDINIKANQILLEQGLIQNAVEQGYGGNINIDTQQLILNQGVLNTGSINNTPNTIKTGRSGNITITAQDTNMYNGSIGSSVLFGQAGNAGNINIDTQSLNLDQNSEINSFNLGTGEAGTIQINSQIINLSNNSNIVTDADYAKGGNVEITAAQTLNISQLSHITAVSASSQQDDQGGNIIIRSGKLYLDTSYLLANANAGTGGNIDIQTPQLNVTGNSYMNVTSKLNLNGDIFINNTNIDTVVTVLPDLVYEPAKLQKCKIKDATERSALVTQNYKVSRQSPYEFYFLSGKRIAKQDLLKKVKENPSPEKLNDLANLLSIELRQNPTMAATEKAAKNLYADAIKQMHKINDKTHQAAIFLNHALFLKENFPFLSFKEQNIVDNAINYIRNVPSTDKKAQFLLSFYLLVKHDDEYLYEAETLADKIQSSYLQSWIYGLLAQTGKNPAINFRKAIFYAENNPELLYRWYWQRGDLLKNTEDYQVAIEEIEKLRPTLTGSYLATTRYFDKLVKAIYLEYMELLLDKVKNTARNQKDLEQILVVLAQFKAVELQNYLQDDCTESITTTSQLASNAFPANTALLYFINLNNQIVSIVQIGEKLEYKTVVGRLRHKTALEALVHKAWLYNTLIRPIKSLLQQNKIKTLVIVPEGIARSIPFAALYDEQAEEYLIQQYSLAWLYQIPDKTLQKSDLLGKKMLLAGVSEKIGAFTPLKQVEKELENIKTVYPQSKLFKNQDFTKTKVGHEIKTTTYPILHFATHAKFASHAEKSFLLAHDKPIFFNELSNLFSPNLNLSRQKTVELLTLSACETLQSSNLGDTEKLALGLAGIGIKTGAQSVLATLWEIDDYTTAELVTEFYKQLQKPEISKAQALKKAQLKLLSNNPKKWAAFVIMGNWL